MWYFTKTENVTNEITTNNDKGLAIFMAFFFRPGNLRTKSTPTKHGMTDKSRLVNKAKNGILICFSFPEVMN